MKLAQFAAKPYYPSLIASIRQICLENSVDDTHGLAHSVQVGQQVEKALRSQPGYNVDNPFFENIILAGYLHDIDDRKYFNTKGCENAVRVLSRLQVPKEQVQQIVTMIDLVSFSKNGNSIQEKYPILYYLPRYIDRVEAIGMEGLYRSYAYNQQRKSCPVFLKETPLPLSRQEAVMFSHNRDIEYMKSGHSKSVVDHFFDKLIHIKLPKQITNPYLINLYEAKLTEMINFIIQNAKEAYINYESNLIEWQSKQHN